MWSHLGGAEFASREHLARYLELPTVSHTVAFLPFCLLFSDFWLLFTFCWTFLYLSPNFVCISDFATPHFDLPMPYYCFPLIFFCLSFLSPGFCLPHSLTICSFSLLFSYFFPPLQHISFSHHPHFGKPCSHTFRDFLGDCKQVSPTLCRHELLLMLQLRKSTGRNPVKQGSTKLEIYCTAYHHMIPWTETQLRIERDSFNLYVP